jgi:RNA polymerase sigma-70 factor (ECF subfamily)
LSDGTSDHAQSGAPHKPVEQLFAEFRPRLHRYCARMTGSVIDGEDVVQETLLKAIEAALQRGRGRLRALAAEAGDAPGPVLAEPERTRLKSYVERFNAHDFDAIRAMLAENVRLELVNRARLDGKKSVAPDFSNYVSRPHWRFIAGFVDRRPAMLVYDAEDPDQRLKYFVLLAWAGEQVTGIRDFVFARYVMDGAELAALD